MRRYNQHMTFSITYSLKKYKYFALYFESEVAALKNKPPKMRYLTTYRLSCKYSEVLGKAIQSKR